MSQWHGGKGSKQRPTDKQKFDENYDRIFKKRSGRTPDIMRKGGPMVDRKKEGLKKACRKLFRF